MLSKTLFVFALFCVVFLGCLNQSIFAHQSFHKHSADASAMKKLQGYKKGDTREGISNLRKYLHHYGYLQDRHLNNSNIDLNYFDENVEFAIKTYQVNFNLKPTGVLDEPTVSLMDMPRCGVPDIIDGKTRMNAGKSYHLSYSFFAGIPKWNKTTLTWAIKPGTRRDVIEAMTNFSMMVWRTFVPEFNFIFQDEDIANSDIKISFDKIDGRGNVVGLGEAPMGGHLQFDIDEDWVYGAVPDKMDMGSTGLHEMGHILGLGHSSDPNAIMWPELGAGVVSHADSDDYQGIRALYPPSSS